MKTKAAVAFAAGKPLEITDVDLDGPREGEVLVEVKATGICHTDEFTLSGADPDSKQWQQPPYAANWHRSIKPEFLVIVGICTHLGCIPKFMPDPSASNPTPNWPGGYFCPCHGSKYDLAGRVFSGVPAPYNLPVPPYHYPDDKTLRVGENAPNVFFEFDSVEQV